MQIHFVVKTWREFSVMVNSNVAPYLSLAKANCRAKEMNEKLTTQEEADEVQYFVESFVIEY